MKSRMGIVVEEGEVIEVKVVEEEEEIILLGLKKGKNS